MPTNPFEDEDGRYFALINDEGQYSLWPAFADIPDGWTVAHGEESRKACLAYIEEHWTDMRPKSLIEEMKKYEQASTNSGRRKSPRQKVRSTVVTEEDAPAGEPAVVGS